MTSQEEQQAGHLNQRDRRDLYIAIDGITRADNATSQEEKDRITQETLNQVSLEFREHVLNPTLDIIFGSDIHSIVHHSLLFDKQLMPDMQSHLDNCPDCQAFKHDLEAGSLLD